jgi:hypothetical protein
MYSSYVLVHWSVFYNDCHEINEDRSISSLLNTVKSKIEFRWIVFIINVA